MNNIYTREYILESVRQGQKDSNGMKDLMSKKADQSTDSLTFDTILNFLKSVVILMLNCAVPSQSVFKSQ